ncbi:MAG: DUF4870 domain-containing protein [Candidatus Sulfotelmatobacter sp.]
MNDVAPQLATVPHTPTTQDDRTMAVLAHVLQMIGGWIAPLVIFLMKRQSRFISFHALQVLLFEGVLFLLTMIGMTVVFVAMGISFALGGFQHKPSGPPVFFFVSFGIVWLGIMASWLVRLVLAIVYGVKAGRGEWAEYPLLGKWARSILHIGPGGSEIPA